MNTNEKLTLEKFMEMNPELVRGLQAAENEFNEAREEQKRPFDIRIDMPEADAIIRQAIRSYGRRYNKETGEFEDMPGREGLDKNE